MKIQNRTALLQKTYFAVLFYLSYLIRLRLLSQDSYLLDGLQSADKTKRMQKQCYKTYQLLPETEATRVCLLLVSTF